MLFIFSLGAILSACTQDQNETTGMGETDPGTTQTETAEPGGTTGDGTQTGQEDLELPEESPAAGGQQSPDTQTDTEIETQSDSGGFDSEPDTGTDSEIESDTESEQSEMGQEQSPGFGN